MTHVIGQPIFGTYIPTDTYLDGLIHDLCNNCSMTDEALCLLEQQTFCRELLIASIIKAAYNYKYSPPPPFLVLPYTYLYTSYRELSYGLSFKALVRYLSIKLLFFYQKSVYLAIYIIGIETVSQYI